MLWCFPPVYLDHFHFNVGVDIVWGEVRLIKSFVYICLTAKIIDTLYPNKAWNKPKWDSF